MSGTTGLGRARSPGISKPALQAPRRKTLGKTEAPAPRPADAEVKTTKAKGTTLRAKDTQATARTMRREKVTKESVGRGGTLRRMSARPESTGPKPSPTDWKDPAFVKAQQALGNDVKTSLADADPSSPNTKVASQAADLVGTGKWTRKAGDGDAQDVGRPATGRALQLLGPRALLQLPGRQRHQGPGHVHV